MLSASLWASRTSLLYPRLWFRDCGLRRSIRSRPFPSQSSSGNLPLRAAAALGCRGCPVESAGRMAKRTCPAPPSKGESTFSSNVAPPNRFKNSATPLLIAAFFKFDGLWAPKEEYEVEKSLLANVWHPQYSSLLLPCLSLWEKASL
jgi:hypothetical protein